MTRRPSSRRALLLAALALGAVPPATAGAAPRDGRDLLDVRLAPLGAPAERTIERPGAALTAPSASSPATVARAFAHDHADALGIDRAAADALRPAALERSDSGLTVVRLRQEVDGIPAFDGGVRVAIDRAGRVLSAAGAPRDDLPEAIGDPRLSAADALRALMDETGAHRALRVTAVPGGPRHTTRFSSGDEAQLVLFGARTVRLAWHLTYQASGTEWYDAVVDADSGAVLYRANLVKSVVNANVYHNYPGAPQGGTRTAADLAPWLDAGATTATGPNVHAFADVNDDNTAQGTEEAPPGAYPYATTATPASRGCDATHLCSWDHTNPTSWDVNAPAQRRANVLQTFWYANHFHDHLASPPIGFDAGSGAFQGDDRLSLNALDGAALGPDADHLDNANMAVPRDGVSPRMQMYLWASGAGSPFRDVNGGDDAAVVFHEYTHGLSARLVTHDDGTQALSTAQAAAMSEGWSDWYALDLLVREGLVPDNGAADGEVDLGRYVDLTPRSLRFEPIDCSVGSASPACPGGGSSGPGGFTFGDFGRIEGRTEPHADGEIWAQTLWQLRQALIDRVGGQAAGSDAAERLITDAMRLSGPEPSFLDMRNAILAADLNAFGGADQALIWDVFRARGMGFFATAADSNDAAPAEDFTAPPAPGAPRGTIQGTVTGADSGLPITGAQVAIAGLDTLPGGAAATATTVAGGTYALGNVPAGSYPRLRFSAAGFDTVFDPVVVGGGGTAAADARLRRDWAALSAGAKVRSTNDDTGAPFGCGVAGVADQALGRGWSAENHLADASPSARYQPQVTLELPAAITVEAFGVDPDATCGDDASASTRGFRLETSPDGSGWTTAAEGSFALGDRGHVNQVAPQAGTTGVRFVRLTLKSPQGTAAGTSGADFIDLSELEVYGSPPNVAPAGTLAVSAGSVAPGHEVTFDASSFTDPDSVITAYAWDFDGDGTADRTTTTPAVTATYDVLGIYSASVAVRDFRGGVGTAGARVQVTQDGTPVVIRRKPAYVLPRKGTKGRVKVRVTCADACRLSGALTVSRTLRRRHHLRHLTVAKLTPRTFKGSRTFTLSLTRDARARLRRRHVRKLTVKLALTGAVTANGPRASASRSVSLTL